MSKPTVVIADDHPLLLKGLQEFLEENNIDVLDSASNGKDALEKILKHHPQLAILDMEMPHFFWARNCCSMQETKTSHQDYFIDTA